MTGIDKPAALAGLLIALHASGAGAQTVSSPGPQSPLIMANKRQADALADQANSAGSTGHFGQAVVGFTDAIALDPEASHFLGRGVAYEHEGRNDQAIADFTKAIAMRPDFTEAYESRGVAYDQKGLYDRAIGDYTKAIALHPGDAQIFFNRGAAYEHRGLFAKATEDYRASLKLDPTLKVSEAGLKRLGDLRSGAGR